MPSLQGKRYEAHRRRAEEDQTTAWRLLRSSEEESLRRILCPYIAVAFSQINLNAHAGLRSSG